MRERIPVGSLQRSPLPQALLHLPAEMPVAGAARGQREVGCVYVSGGGCTRVCATQGSYTCRRPAANEHILTQQANESAQLASSSAVWKRENKTDLLIRRSETRTRAGLHRSILVGFHLNLLL